MVSLKPSLQRVLVAVRLRSGPGRARPRATERELPGPTLDRDPVRLRESVTRNGVSAGTVATGPPIFQAPDIPAGTPVPGGKWGWSLLADAATSLIVEVVSKPGAGSQLTGRSLLP
jgi:hypothetical protein